MAKHSFLALLLASLAPASWAQPAIPPASSILSTLKPGHPRLLVPPGGFAAVKAGLPGNTEATAWAAGVEAAARRLLTAEASRYEIPDGLRLLATSRQVKERVHQLALAYHLTGDTAFAARAWRELEAAAAFKDWNPKHFLDVGEMTHAFAIGYDWLHGWLTPARRTVVRNAIRDKGLRVADSAYKAKVWWASSRFNWNQVCNGGIALGALALAEDEPALAASLLHAALSSVVAAKSMEEFAPDGGWAEGPGYWAYTIEYTALLLAGLESSLGTDFGIRDIRGLDQAGFFPLYLTGPTGRAFNYADGGDSPPREAGQFWMAKAYRQPLYAWARRNLGNTYGPKDLLWAVPSGPGPRESGLALDRHFRHLDLVSMRGAWEDSLALFAGFKAGSNAVGHSHLDLGTFLLEAQGVRWAGELGSDNYNLPGYFSAGGPRWQYYRLRAEGQNTLVLNPHLGPDQDPDATAAITRFSSHPDEAVAIADLTPAYRGRAPGLKSVQRGFALFQDRGRFLVQDEIAADSAQEIWWFMHTRSQVQLSGDGISATLTQNGKRLYARLLTPAGARLELRAAAPLPTSPNDTNQNRNEGWRKLAVHLAGTREARITVLLVPLATGAAPPTDFPAARPLGPLWPSGKQTGIAWGPSRQLRRAKAMPLWQGHRFRPDGRRLAILPVAAENGQ